MKKILMTSVALVLASTAFATLPRLPIDGTGQKLQGFAPDGRKSSALTANSVVKDMTSDVRWSAYTPTACKFRILSTATKVGPAYTLPAGATTERVVNQSTPFGNWTGCTSGELFRQ
jgi:hypothetical protein